MMEAREYLKKPYTQIITADETGGYYAEILEFPGCLAEGETPSEAFANLENAAESWIEACIESGQEIPQPTNSAAFSGKIALRVPKSIHRQASIMAERDGTSLNQFLVSAISYRLGAEDAMASLMRRFSAINVGHVVISHINLSLGNPAPLLLGEKQLMGTTASTGEGATNAGN